MGTPCNSKDLIEATGCKILKDLEKLKQFPHLHQRTKLAVYCCNTRISCFQYQNLCVLLES